TSNGGILDQKVGDHTAIFTATDGHLFENGQTTLEVPYTITAKLTGERCPRTVEPCVVITGPTILTQKDQFADSDDDRSAGNFEFTADGLRIWTDDNSSNAKIAWYHNVDYAL